MFDCGECLAPRSARRLRTPHPRAPARRCVVFAHAPSLGLAPSWRCGPCPTYVSAEIVLGDHRILLLSLRGEPKGAADLALLAAAANLAVSNSPPSTAPGGRTS
jgi:hypothetical protein